MARPRRTSALAQIGLAAAGAAAIGLWSWAAAAADAPAVTVTIKPVHALVAAVMGDVGEPALLIDGGGSPHFYSLRPSDAARIGASDLVVWVGEDMEKFMEEPLAALASKATVLELADLPGVTLLETREGGEWEPEAEEHGHHGHDHGKDGHAGDGHAGDGQAGEKHAEGHQGEAHHGHEHGEHDMHLWLDPANARAIVAAVADTLARIDPARADAYRANAAAARAGIDRLEASLRDRLAPVRKAPYVVFHDAYQYYERAFGLSAVGSVTVSPEAAPGARRLYELRRRITDLGVRCVFAEPQFEPRIVRTVIEGTPARAGVLDPLGAAVPAGAGAYAAVMNGIADSLLSCLGG